MFTILYLVILFLTDSILFSDNVFIACIFADAIVISVKVASSAIRRHYRYELEKKKIDAAFQKKRRVDDDE